MPIKLEKVGEGARVTFDRVAELTQTIAADPRATALEIVENAFREDMPGDTRENRRGSLQPLLDAFPNARVLRVQATSSRSRGCSRRASCRRCARWTCVCSTWNERRSGRASSSSGPMPR